MRRIRRRPAVDRIMVACEAGGQRRRSSSRPATWVTPAERDAIGRLLAVCPGQGLPWGIKGR